MATGLELDDGVQWDRYLVHTEDKAFPPWSLFYQSSIVQQEGVKSHDSMFILVA